MRKIQGVILFTAIVVVLVGIIVFSVGNNPPTAQGGQNPPSNIPPASSGSNTPPTGEKVSATELAIHDTQTDCWVGYGGKVYDITDWLPRHPGSAEAIAPYCGTSAEFEAAFEGQHGQSQVGRLTREGVYKGDLE